MGLAGQLVVAAALLGWLIALSAFDIRYGRLPNGLTLPGAVVILAAAAGAGHGVAAALGAVGLFAVYATVHLLTPAAMGAGDVKLAIGLGALTGMFGPDVWMIGALGAPVLTVLSAPVLLARGTRTVPHGPSMCLAAAGAVAMVVL